MSDIVIRNPNATKLYIIPTIGTWTGNKRTGVTSMPLPEDEGDNNTLTKLTGAELSTSLDFILESDGVTDKSNGDNIITVWEQLIYLLTYFASGKMEYTLEFYAGADGFDDISGEDYDEIHMTGEVSPVCDYKFKGQVEDISWMFEGGLNTCKILIKIAIGLPI